MSFEYQRTMIECEGNTISSKNGKNFKNIKNLDLLLTFSYNQTIYVNLI